MSYLNRMYSTCLFCNTPFERNESLEAFPIGRRLAFDAAKGRLWVVCRKCERWCLSPLDERWEAIEQAERLYRDTRRRVATDNIGLAKVAEGTTLIRIGDPLRPEFAAWRYGDQFGRRRMRRLLITGGGLAAVGLALGGGIIPAGILGYVLVGRVGGSIVHGGAETIVAKVRDSSGEVMRVRRRHLGASVLSRAENGSMELELRCTGNVRPILGSGPDITRRFEGAEAQRVAAVLLPKVNRFGGSARHVAEAVREIDAMGTAARFIDELTGMARGYTYITANPHGRWSRDRDFKDKGLFRLPAHKRLALEMALHEEAERRAIEGELAELERAWRDAEEIAGIADNLAMPPGVDAALQDLKRRV